MRPGAARHLPAAAGPAEATGALQSWNRGAGRNLSGAYAGLIGCLDVPDKEAVARTVLATLVRAFRMDLNWQMRQLQIDGQKAALVNQ